MDHVADLSGVSGIVSGLCTGKAPRTAPPQNGQATSRKPQSRVLQGKQFGGQPSMGTTSTPGYKPRHAAESVATDMVGAAA